MPKPEAGEEAAYAANELSQPRILNRMRVHIFGRATVTIFKIIKHFL